MSMASRVATGSRTGCISAKSDKCLKARTVSGESRNREILMIAIHSRKRQRGLIWFGAARAIIGIFLAAALACCTATPATAAEDLYRGVQSEGKGFRHSVRLSRPVFRQAQTRRAGHPRSAIRPDRRLRQGENRRRAQGAWLEAVAFTSSGACCLCRDGARRAEIHRHVGWSAIRFTTRRAARGGCQARDEHCAADRGGIGEGEHQRYGAEQDAVLDAGLARGRAGLGSCLGRTPGLE